MKATNTSKMSNSTNKHGALSKYTYGISYLTVFHCYNKLLWFFGCPICYFEEITDRQTVEDRQIDI